MKILLRKLVITSMAIGAMIWNDILLTPLLFNSFGRHLTDSSANENIAVFYNAFAKSVDDITVVKAIVKEQFDLLLPEHNVFVRSIGAQFHIDKSTLIRHDTEGDESGTLQLVWEYCNEFPDRKVVYLHSKGSFHNTVQNTEMRRFITRGALSKECANLPSSCNVCSSRMSPVPHPHTPGNMWLARCSYVLGLIEPKDFQSEMNKVSFTRDGRTVRIAPSFVGKERFAAEHWVHSHPSVMPCDLYDKKKYTWKYRRIPEHNFPIILKPAPRFDLEVYEKHCPDNVGSNLKDRLEEYQTLYGENPSESWWGWALFKNQDTLSQ